MKPSEFLSEIEKIQLWLVEENKKLTYSYRDYIGFFPSVVDSQRFMALSQGYWSSLLFASITDITNISLRIFPETDFKNWPVFQSQQGIYSYTFCNTLSNFIAFNQIRMLQTKELFPYISTDWDTFMQVAAPLLILFGTTDDSLQYIKDYAFNPENLPLSNNPKDNVAKYLEFWNHYDKSEGHKVLREIITSLNEDEKWLPNALPECDLGIWETRIKNLLMSRAKSNRVIYGNEQVKDFIINGYSEPHGYDAEDLIFSHYPISNMSKITINAVVGYFALVPEVLPESFRTSPLFNGALKINQNFNAYQGEEHYQAALVLEKEGKPLEAWNALVSASYWAGVNGNPEGVEKHWQKAIEICKNQNWSDAVDALTTQWDCYQDYKSKNEIKS